MGSFSPIINQTVTFNVPLLTQVLKVENHQSFYNDDTLKEA